MPSVKNKQAIIWLGLVASIASVGGYTVLRRQPLGTAYTNCFKNGQCSQDIYLQNGHKRLTVDETNKLFNDPFIKSLATQVDRVYLSNAPDGSISLILTAKVDGVEQAFIVPSFRNPEGAPIAVDLGCVLQRLMVANILIKNPQFRNWGELYGGISKMVPELQQSLTASGLKTVHVNGLQHPVDQLPAVYRDLAATGSSSNYLVHHPF